MKLNVAVTLMSILLFLGCMQSAKDQDYQPLEMTPDSSPAPAPEVAPEPVPSTTLPDDHASLESQLDNDHTAAPTQSNETESQETATTSNDSFAGTQPEPIPVTEKAAPSSPKKVKSLKSDVKFKISKKASAKAQIIDDNKGVQVLFSADKVKKNTYTLVVEDSCKKKDSHSKKKSKSVKVAQFKVKENKFSGKSSVKSISLRSGNSKFIGKKALVLYMGAKANIRVSCEMLKIK